MSMGLQISSVYVVFSWMSELGMYLEVMTECAPPSFDRSKLWSFTIMFSHRSDLAKLGNGAASSERSNAVVCGACITEG